MADVETVTSTTMVMSTDNSSADEKSQSLSLHIDPSLSTPTLPLKFSTSPPPVPSKTVTKSPSNSWLKRSNTSIDRTSASASFTNGSNKKLSVPFRPQSILLLPTPVLVQSPTGTGNDNYIGSPVADNQNNLIRTRNSSSTSASSSSSATDASTSTSASDCTSDTTASTSCSTSTSVTSTSPPTIHAPSSSAPAPCVTFAPLPSIAPRTRKSNRPLGVAARAALLRGRHQHQYQYYEQPERGYDYNSQPDYNYNEQVYAGQHHIVEVEEQRKEKEKSRSGKRRGKGVVEGRGESQPTVLDEQDDAFATLGKLLNEAGRSLWRRFSQRTPSSSSQSSSLPTASSMTDVSTSALTSSVTSSKKGSGSNGLRRLSSVSVRAKKSKKKHIIADELANPTILDGSGEMEFDADDDEKKTEDDSGNWKSSKRSEDPMTKTIRIDSDDEQELVSITVPARLTAEDVHALEEDITARCDIEDDILVGHSPSLDLERAHGEIHSPTTVEVRIVTDDQ